MHKNPFSSAYAFLPFRTKSFAGAEETYFTVSPLLSQSLRVEDVKSDDWFAPYVGVAAKVGIIVGSDGKFRPNDTITREEMAVIIVKAYTYLGGKGANGAIDNFSDKNSISAWAKAYVDSAASVGLISGMGDGTFGPKANATRAQAASVVYRVIK